MQCVLELKGLSKRFKDLTAVDGVSLTINEGEIFGLLGPNGAGKTTIIKMLCTILNPTSGSASVCSHDVITERDLVRKSIGVVFQDQSTDEELTAYENMMFHAHIYNVGGDFKGRIRELLELVELYDKKDKLVKEFSGGMKRRLEIARGLLHKPKVLFLDEPTVGLDPQTRTKIWDYIRELNSKEKITIILTTHYMEEADTLCTRIGIIDRGKIIAEGTPDTLKEGLRGDSITIGTPDPEALKAALGKDKTITKITIHDSHITLNVPKAETRVADIVKLAERRKIAISTISLSKPTLNDVFLHFTGRSIRQEEAEGMGAKVRMMRGMRR
jgi:ABC-2 type transport system ATP-binding protein